MIGLLGHGEARLEGLVHLVERLHIGLGHPQARKHLPQPLLNSSGMNTLHLVETGARETGRQMTEGRRHTPLVDHLDQHSLHLCSGQASCCH